MAFELPDLPYAYDALEPHIDAETMRIHHDLHHGAYVDERERRARGDGAGGRLGRERAHEPRRTCPRTSRPPVRNNAGGHANHSLFWKIMSPDGGGEPGGALRSRDRGRVRLASTSCAPRSTTAA